MSAVLHRPTRIDEVFRLLDRDAMVLSGGTAIQILLKQGLLFTERLVDVARVPGMDIIGRVGDATRIGGMVSLRQIETNPVIRAVAPLLSEVCGRVANPRVRNTASIAGNIAHGDHRLDPPTALMVLDARIEVASGRGDRSVPARAFFVGFQQTALAPDELIVAVTVPDQPVGSRHAYAKLSSLGGNDWPSASAAALIVRDGSTARLGLGLGAMAEVPHYVDLDLTGLDLDTALDVARHAADGVIGPIPDIRGSGPYKRRLGLVAVADAVSRAWSRAEHGGIA